METGNEKGFRKKTAENKETKDEFSLALQGGLFVYAALSGDIFSVSGNAGTRFHCIRIYQF